MGGRQVITTPDGYVFKLKFHFGMMYIPMRYPTDYEINDLPRVFLTSDAELWNPDLFNDREADEQSFDSLSDTAADALDDNEFFDTRNGFVYDFHYSANVNKNHAHKKVKDFEKLRRFFLLKPIEAIKKTYGITTQFAKTV